MIENIITTNSTNSFCFSFLQFNIRSIKNEEGKI